MHRRKIEIIIAQLNPKQFICPLCGSIEDMPLKPGPILLHNENIKDTADEICDACVIRLMECCDDMKDLFGTCKICFDTCKECVEYYEQQKTKSN